MERLQQSLGRFGSEIAFFAALIGWLALVALRAHVTEDAYITFRVVYNFVHGYGLRFNIDERVQAYTNPLWMLLHIPFFALWPNIEAITLALSYLCAFGTFYFLYRTFALSPLRAAIFVLLPMCLSLTLTYFFTSGLENPLTCLLFAWFGYELWRIDKPGRWFWLLLPVGLSFCNRMDTLLAYLPILSYLFITRRRQIAWRSVAAAGLPVALWLVFSLFYYGFLFPNTKYAKLGTGLAESEYLKHGLAYAADFFLNDPVAALLVIGMALLTLGSYAPRFFSAPGDETNAKRFMIGLGMIAYSLYVISVAGSYISCLFFTLPALMAVWLIGADIPAALSGRQMLLPAAAFSILYALTYLPAWNEADVSIRRPNRIDMFNAGFRLMPHPGHYPHPHDILTAYPVKACDHPNALEFRLIKSIHRKEYYEGACIHFVDQNGLSDPLIARLPMAGRRLVKVGHYMREPPRGYLETLETGSLAAMPWPLAQYYAPLRLIVSGDLWDPERLETIVLFNLGNYDHWRRQYLTGHP